MGCIASSDLISISKKKILLFNVQAFFITNLEPVKFWEFISLLLEGLGYQR